MRDRESSIVALFGRGRELAYAAFEHGDLVRFGIKTVRGRRSGRAFQEAVRRAVTAILLHVDKPLVVIERMDPRQRHGGLSRTLPSVVASTAVPSRIRTIPLSDAKRRFCGHTSATHRELREGIAVRHPLLRSLHPSKGIRVTCAFGLALTIHPQFAANARTRAARHPSQHGTHRHACGDQRALCQQP